MSPGSAPAASTRVHTLTRAEKQGCFLTTCPQRELRDQGPTGHIPLGTAGPDHPESPKTGSPISNLPLLPPPCWSSVASQTPGHPRECSSTPGLSYGAALTRGQSKEGALRVPVLQDKASQQRHSDALAQVTGQETRQSQDSHHTFCPVSHAVVSDHATLSFEYPTYSHDQAVGHARLPRSADTGRFGSTSSFSISRTLASPDYAPVVLRLLPGGGPRDPWVSPPSPLSAFTTLSFPLVSPPRAHFLLSIFFAGLHWGFLGGFAGKNPPAPRET